MRFPWIATCTIAAILAIGCAQPPATAPGSSAGVSASAAPSGQQSTAPSARDETTGVTQTEIVIGSCAALSGQMRQRGQQVVNGGKAWIDHVNEQGGINGRTIKLISRDDAYDPEKAIDCFNQLLSDRVFAGTLFQGTVQAAKYLPMGESHHLPLVGFSTGGEFLYDPFHEDIFTVRASYADEAKKQIETLVEKLGKKKIAVIYQNDAFGAACLEGVVNAMKKYHMTPVAQVSLPHLTRDVTAVEQIRSAAPDAVVLGATADALVEIVKYRTAQKWKTTFVCFSVGSDILVDKARTDADGILVTQTLPLTQDSLPGVALYKQLAPKVPGGDIGYSNFEGYVIAMVLTEGLKRAGKDLTRDGLVHALESIQDLDIGLGSEFKVNFGPRNHNGMRAVLVTIVQNGQITSISDWDALK